MTEFEPDTYYATVFEKLTRLDGSPSHYAQLNNGHQIYCVNERIDSKADLLKAVEQIIDRIVTYKDFTVTENKHGWVFERYIKWDADDSEYVVTEPGEHSDHELYTVEITRFIEEHEPMAHLTRRDEVNHIIRSYKEEYE